MSFTAYVLSSVFCLILLSFCTLSFFFLSYPSSVYGENNHKFHLDLDLNNSLKSATFVHYNEGMSENLVIMHT